MGRKTQFDSVVPWDSRWVQIPGYPQYWVSQYKQIFNMPMQRLMHQFISNKNVRCIRLYRDNKRATRSVAKLVRELHGETR